MSQKAKLLEDLLKTACEELEKHGIEDRSLRHWWDTQQPTYPGAKLRIYREACTRWVDSQSSMHKLSSEELKLWTESSDLPTLETTTEVEQQAAARMRWNLLHACSGMNYGSVNVDGQRVRGLPRVYMGYVAAKKEAEWFNSMLPIAMFVPLPVSLNIERGYCG